MKIVFRNSRVPKWISWFFEVRACAFAVFVWCRDDGDDRLINHETIHVAQQFEMLFIGQWVMYCIFMLIGLIKHRNFQKAYRNNPFEREAYANDEDLVYLVNRPLWAWTRYVRVKDKYQEL